MHRPVVVTSWFQPRHAGVFNGQYDWPLIEGRAPDGTRFKAYSDLEALKRLQARRESETRKRIRSGLADFHLAGVWPGFDDQGTWGWGGGPRCIPRLDGLVYRYQWARARKSGFRVVQIATWNDWFEATHVEPSAESGCKYLEITRECVAGFKGETVPKGDLLLPGRIYALRKSPATGARLAVAEDASRLIAAGDYRKAAELMAAHAKPQE